MTNDPCSIILKKQPHLSRFFSPCYASTTLHLQKVDTQSQHEIQSCDLNIIYEPSPLSFTIPRSPLLFFKFSENPLFQQLHQQGRLLLLNWVDCCFCIFVRRGHNIQRTFLIEKHGILVGFGHLLRLQTLQSEQTRQSPEEAARISFFVLSSCRLVMVQRYAISRNQKLPIWPNL